MHRAAISVITAIMVSNSDHALQQGEQSTAFQPKHLQLHKQPFRKTSCTIKKLFPNLIFAVSPFPNYIVPLITHLFILVIHTPNPPKKPSKHSNPFISSFDPLSSLTPQATWAIHTFPGSMDIRVSVIPGTHMTSLPSCEDTCWWELSFPN